MKKLLLLFVMIVMAMTVMAQTTEKITYQAVVRDRTNRLVVYTPVRVDVTITYSSGSYFESLRDTTNANGLMYVLIGGNPGFENINWQRAVIKTVITIEGGETVSDEVVVTAVPIALQANYAMNVSPTAPTIVAVYNQLQADSLALANRIAAERAHLDDTLSHYLMQEVQVLSISNDTIYLTGGSFVKLPAGFSGNYNDLTNLPDLNQYATNVHLNDTLSHYLMQEVQVLSVSNDTLYLTGGSWVKLPQGFSGNYNDLTNLPDLNQYATNVHLNDTLSHYLMQEVQVLSVSNDTLYLTGGSWVKLPQGFSGDYNDLTNLPDLNQYATNVHLNDTLKNYLTINGLCDSIKNCEAITNLQTADSLLGVRITRDSIVLSGKIYSDSVYLKGLIDSIKVNVTNNTTNITNNTTNISNITNNVTSLQVADSVLSDRFTRDSIALSNRLDTMFAHICDSIAQCDVITNLQAADSLLGNRITRDSILFYKTDSILANRITRDSILSYKADSILAVRITRDSIFFYKADSILSMRITADSINLVNNYYDKIKINDTVAYILSQITTASGNLNDNYYTKVEINDTLSHYTTTDRIDSLLGDYVKKDTLENYLTIAGLCDSIKNCEVITNLQNADSLLGVRITRDSILFYKTDSILAAHILIDSVVSYKTDSILSVRISTDSANLADNYYTKVEINDTLSHYTTSDIIDSLLGDFVKKDTLENYLTIAGLCDSIKNCEVITNLQTADSLLGVRITRDSILSYKADSVLSARITADSINLVNNYYDKIKINDTVAYILSQITTASGNLNDNYYTKVEINDTLSHYTTTDRIDSLLGDYVKKDTLENYLTIAGLCDSIKNCEVITNLQTADSLLAVRVTRDSILSHMVDSVLSARIINDSILFHKTDSVLLVHILNDSILSYHADSIILARILNDSILSHKADSILAAHILIDSVVSYRADSILSVRITADSANLANNYYTKVEINDTLSHYTTSDNIDSLLGDFVKKDTLENYLTIAGLCDSIKNCEVITNLQTADSLLGNRITRDSILSYKADSILANRITRDSILSYKADSILANRITRDSVLFYKADSILAVRITRDSLLSYKADSILLARITADSINLVNNYYDKIIINDTVAYILSQITTASGNLNDNYYTKVEINDTLSHYTTSDRIDSLLGDYVKKDTLKNYLTIAGLCDSIKNCDVITNLQAADSLLGVRITRDSILSYKTDSILVDRITRDSILSYKADSVLSTRITADSLNLVNNYYNKIKINDTVAYILSQIAGATGNLNDNYYTKSEINDTLSHYTTSDHVDSLLGDYVKKDTLKNYLTIAGLCDSIKNCDVIANMATGITTNTTNISNNTTNITNNTTNITNLQIADSVLNARFTKDSTILANRMDTLLKHVCDSVKPCVTEWMNDTLKAYTTSNKIDTLIQKYGYVTTAHLNDTLSRYTTTNKIDTLIQKYGYTTTAHLNDTLGHYTTSNQVDTLLTAYEKKADLCNDVMVCIGDTLSKYTTSNKIDTLLGAYATNAHLNDTLRYYTTTNKIDTLIQKYGYATTAHLNDTLSRYTTTNKIDTLIQKYGYTTTAHLNDTLRRYTTTNQIDTLIKKYGYLTSDSAVIVRMRDSIQKVNNRLTYDSTALAHRMDTLLKHVCDSVKPCVTGWMNDTLKAYTTSNKIDTLLGAYATNAHLNDTLKVYTTTNKIDTLIQKYGYTTAAHLNDTLGHYTTSNQVDTLLTAYEKKADLCNDVMVCIGDTLSKYTTSNKIDTLLGAYATNAHLNDTLRYYTTTNKIDTLIQKYGYATTAHLNDTLGHYTTSNQVDTLLTAYEKKADLCKDVMGCIGDTLSKYTTTNNIDTLIQKYGYTTIAHLNDTLRRYTTTNQIDTLIKKYGYLTSDSAVIVRMRDSIQKVNNRLTYDSTALAHRMDTLLKHVCDSVKPCVTGWMNDTLKAYTTSNKIDTLLGAYATNAHLNDTLSRYTTTNKIDTLIQKYGYTTTAHLNDTLRRYTTTNQIDTLIKKYGYLTSDSAVIVRMRDSIQKVNNRLTYDSTALAHRMDTLLKHVCDSVKPCVTGWMNDTLKAYTTSNKIDTLLGAYVTNAHLNDTLSRYTTTNKIDTLIQKYGYTTTAHLNDTLRRYTTTNQIDTLIKKYGYLTSDSAVIVRMRDSIQKVNNRLTYDSTALAHRMDTLLKHVCDSVKPCVTGWMNDTLKVYTTTNKIDTLIQKYGYTTTAHLNDTLRKYTTSDHVDTLLNAYEKRADLCKDVMGCIGDTLSKYTTTNQIDTLIKKYGYLTSDSAVIVRMRDSIQKVNNRLTYDSTALAHRMDTLLKHVCDSVKPCVTGWMNDTLKAYTTSNKIDTLLGAYVTNAHLNDTLKVYTTTNKIDTLIQKYGYTTTAHLNDTLRRYTTTNQIDTLIKKYGYLTSDSAVIVRMRDSIQKVNNRLTYDSTKLADRIHTDSITLVNRIVTDSTALAHRMDTLLKHVCDSVQPCVTAWIKDSLKVVKGKMHNDSLALAQRIYKDSVAVMDTLHKYYATKDTLKNFVKKDALCTEVMACDGIKTMRDSIQKVNNRLTNDSTKLADRIHTDSIALVNRIVTDSTALAHRMDTLLKHVCDSVKPCVTGWIKDSTRMVFDSLHRYYTSLSTLADSMHRVDVRIKHDSLEVVELYKQAQVALQTLALKEKTDSLTLATRMDTVYKHLCDSVMNCDGIKTMQTNITDVINNLDSSKTNIRSEISSLNTKLQSNIDSTSQHVRGALRDTAAAIRNSIGKGTLTIQYGTDDPVTFNANQKTDTSIIIPVPTAPNDATLTIQKNGTTVGTFTANQAADQTIDITVPTCDSLAECDLIKSILARLDKLERQNDSLAKEIEKLQPALTVTGPQKDTVCSGSTKPVTYKATFHNCSSSDYTLAWKVNGVDSSAVTGAVFTLNVENEGSYKVVCIATRSDSTFVTDTVTTMVTVDSKVPFFTVTIEGLTVTLSNVTNTETIQWDTDSLPESFTSTTHTYSVADTISITAMSKRGCTFTKDTVLQPISPVVTTDSVPASTIAATTAKAYGTVISDGGIPETKRGILYSTSDQNLEYGANGVDSVMNGTGKGNYVCTLERLVPCTQYYVRAFAYNEVDTVYGAILNFTTPSFTCGSTLYDIDGNDYATLLLGSQCWMKQNLRTSHYANGDTILLSNVVDGSSPARYMPASADSLKAYGYLYNWAAATRGYSSAANPSTVQGACPDGWHLPSDAEWTQLTAYIASDAANVCDNNPEYIIKSMVSGSEWCPTTQPECFICYNPSSNNHSEFSVRAAGTWNNGSGDFGPTTGYTNLGHTIFTTSTAYENPNTAAWAREFYTEHRYVDRTAIYKTIGLSVRCVLDCSAGHTYLPTVSPVSLTNTSGTTVNMAASVVSDGDTTVTERGVCWGTSSQPTVSGDHIAADVAGIGDFTVTGNLTADTTYYVRAYATNSEGTAYGAEVTFIISVQKFPPTVNTGSKFLALSEGFEDSTLPSTWTIIDNDNDGNNWYRESMKAKTGNGHAASASAIQTPQDDLIPLSPNNYLITPDITIPTDISTILTFWYSGFYYRSQEHFLVKVGNAGASSVGDFNTQVFEETTSAEYEQANIDLSSYAGQTIRLAFIHNNTYDKYQLCIDDIVVGEAGAGATIVSDITGNSAICGGYVSNDGGATVTARGVCWSTSQNPTARDSHTTDGGGTGSFTSNITGLNPLTTYYVRAYAINSADTSYGSQVSFTTTEATPEVTTSAVSDITATTATCGGNVTDAGAYAVTARGVCWSTSTNPTISDSHTTDGSGLGSFTSNITGLTAGTTYYVRAYATNSAGTAYGNQVSFTLPVVDTKSCPSAPVVTDHEGNVYATVQIGNQCWMRENLRTTTSPKTGTYLVNTQHHHPSGNVSSYRGSKVAHWFNQDSTQYASKNYGLLYNWCAAVDSANPTPSYVEVPTPGNGNDNCFDFEPSSPHRGICPAGWHLPSQAEWDTLQTTVGDTNALRLADGNDWRDCEGDTPGYTPCNKNHIDRNTSGFTALPAGQFGYSEMQWGSCSMNGMNARFWGATQCFESNQPKKAWYMDLLYSSKQVVVGAIDKGNGLSVRCVRDEGSSGGSTPSTPSLSVTSDPTAPTVCGSSTATVIYTASITDGEMSDYNYTWSSNPSGTVGANGYTYTVTYTEANTYTVTCTATPTGSGDALSASTQTTVSEDPNCGGSTPSCNLVNLGSLSANYEAQDCDTLTGTLAGNYKITIADGATVVLRNITINGTHSNSYAWAGINCLSDATLILEGTNTVKGFHKDYPGVHVAEGGTLTIQGTDTDTLIASSNGSGSGIGGGAGVACGNIVINGGNINARGGQQAAGIGSGATSSCGKITINVGTVTATGGKYGAGIGTGIAASCEDITINGDTVIAQGGEKAAGIGTGDGQAYPSECGDIIINGGYVKATGGYEGAGIGTGRSYNQTNTCGSIIINECDTVIAIGGNSGAGIGTGAAYTVNVNATNTCESISINDGIVKAIAGQYAAGIGTGRGWVATDTCGDIRISGGKVYATGNQGSAGIGTGLSYNKCVCGDIIITGGEVIAEALQMAAGIGSGIATDRCRTYEGYNYNPHSTCGNISITGGTVEAKGGTSNNFEGISFKGGAGIGTGSGGSYIEEFSSICGSITIGSGVTRVKATKGSGATNSIGKNHSNDPGSCGTVTIEDPTKVTQN